MQTNLHLKLAVPTFWSAMRETPRGYFAPAMAFVWAILENATPALSSAASTCTGGGSHVDDNS